MPRGRPSKEQKRDAMQQARQKGGNKADGGNKPPADRTATTGQPEPRSAGYSADGGRGSVGNSGRKAASGAPMVTRSKVPHRGAQGRHSSNSRSTRSSSSSSNNNSSRTRGDAARTPQGAAPAAGIFGPARAVHGVTEAQARGALHVHFLLWLESPGSAF